MIFFAYPKFLLLLFLIPLFVLVYFLSILYNRKKAINFPNFEALERIHGIDFFSENYLSMYAQIIILALLVFALAGTSISYQAESSSYSYVIAIDNSASMNVNDISPSRFEAAKSSANEFVDSMPAGTDFGVLGFSGEALVMQNLDNSKVKTKMAIDSLELGNLQGTNVYNALIASKEIFKDKEKKALILISDGQINAVDAPLIIRYATRNNIIINTLSVGTLAGGTTELNTTSKVDEDFLKSLAFNTYGKFFRIQDNTDFKESFIELMQKKEIIIDISMYLVLAAIFLFSVNWVLQTFKFRFLP